MRGPEARKNGRMPGGAALVSGPRCSFPDNDYPNDNIQRHPFVWRCFQISSLGRSKNLERREGGLQVLFCFRRSLGGLVTSGYLLVVEKLEDIFLCVLNVDN